VSDDVWREFFDGFAPQCMNEVFTGDGVREAAFLVDLLQLPAGSSLLDIGCGTGGTPCSSPRLGTP
jgi:cyclopropane fatty-acyl-phospholipid synthase-like methyltransferase